MFLTRTAELRRIAAFVEQFCAAAGVSREGGLRLNLILEEFFVNTIRHGLRGERDAPVWITLQAHDGAVRVTYEDNAPPFNPYAYQTKNAGSRIGGLGVLLTRELAAARDYAYLFGRNRIRLELMP